MKKVEGTENVYVEVGINKLEGTEYNVYYIKTKTGVFIETDLKDLIEEGLI